MLAEKNGDFWLQNLRGEYPLHEAALAKHNGNVMVHRNYYSEYIIIVLILFIVGRTSNTVQLEGNLTFINNHCK